MVTVMHSAELRIDTSEVNVMMFILVLDFQLDFKNLFFSHISTQNCTIFKYHQNYCATRAVQQNGTSGITINQKYFDIL